MEELFEKVVQNNDALQVHRSKSINEVMLPLSSHWQCSPGFRNSAQEFHDLAADSITFQ